MDLKLDLENYPIWYKPFWQTLKFKIGISILVLLLLFIIIFFVYKFYKSRTKKYWEIALDKIEKIKLIKDEKSSYFVLTFILKEYFSKRFNINFKNKTDDELLVNASRIDLLKTFENDLKNIFYTAKLMKFSRDLNQGDLALNLKLSSSIIKSTIPKDK